MQTFLPSSSFEASAAVLDRQRLGKQRVEARQILESLQGGDGWIDHPAVRMWRGHQAWLARYGIAVCEAWLQRGYADSLLPWFASHVRTLPLGPPPHWLGRPSFHLAHRSNLVRKDPLYYGPIWPDVPDSIPYEWPL